MQDFQSRAKILLESDTELEFCELASFQIDNDVHQATINIYQDETIYNLIHWCRKEDSDSDSVTSTYLYQNCELRNVVFFKTIEELQIAFAKLSLQISY